jgi:MtN3 and saliva related transmembrane protein
MLVELIGTCAAILTTVSFLPQVIKTWRSRSAADLSMAMLLTFSLGLFLWAIYGLCLGSVPIIAANTITLGLTGSILWFKLRFQRG